MGMPRKCSRLPDPCDRIRHRLCSKLTIGGSLSPLRTGGGNQTGGEKMAHGPKLHSLQHHDRHAWEPPRRAPVQPVLRSSEYALIHQGRQARLGPVAFWIVVRPLATPAVWTASTGPSF